MPKSRVETGGHDRDALEHLARYLARPPIATERLTESDGRVVYGLRRHWKDDTSAVVFDPLDFIARLAAWMRAWPSLERGAF